MADDADAVDPQERRSAVFRVVEAPCSATEQGHHLGARRGQPRVRSHLALHQGHDKLSRAFAGLQHHVARESITDNDICRMVEDIPPFNVADEVGESVLSSV